MSRHSRKQSPTKVNNASLQAAIREGVQAELARMGINPADAQAQMPLVPSRFDPKKLGGSAPRQQQILQTLSKQSGMPNAPSANFIPADQSIMDLMYQALAPQNPDTATPLYSPGVPLLPIPGVTPPAGPRQWSYTVGGNISMAPRGEEQWSFAELRSLARTYEGFQICTQVWLDYVGKLRLKVEPREGLLKEDMDASVFDADIAKYEDFFAYPDKIHDFKSWLKMIVRDQLEVDAVSVYPHLTNAGDLYALELLDPTTIKPLYDDRGRRPEPPFPAYAQYLYEGVPAAWLTTDELIYMIETERTDSMYGTSRVEKTIMRANQALRKLSKDLLKFTEGTVPSGIISVPSDSAWTQDQLEEFEYNLNALLAGNDAMRARLKVLPKGFVYAPTDDPAIQTAFDLYCLNITAASFGLTMDELGFTGSSNRSVGQTQENVIYRRTIQPLVSRCEDLLTFVLRKFFNETRFVVRFKGFEEVEDFAANVSTYTQLVQAGIQSPTQAAQALHLPVYNDENVPPFVMTKTGPFVISDLANDALRDAQVQAQLSGLYLAQTGSKEQQGSQQEDEDEDEEQKPAPDARAASADYRRWRERAIADVKAGRNLRGFTTTAIPDYIHRHISVELERCTTAEDVKAVFAHVRQHMQQGVTV